MTKSKKKAIAAASIITIAAVVTVGYLTYSIPADDSALDKLQSDDKVTVEIKDDGFLFDGASTDDLLIFYPGGNVEETAYAPLLNRIAELGADVYLVKMPFDLAVFGSDKATEIITSTDYYRYYIGGHSLGGAMAANFAADNSDKIDGVILCAAYPTKKLPNTLWELSIYGSRDGVLNMDNYEKGKIYAPNNFDELIIDGGNHAQFGNYGRQHGDGDAAVSAREQQEITANKIIESITKASDNYERKN